MNGRLRLEFEKLPSSDVLMQRLREYQACVEAYALTHGIPIQWTEKIARKEKHIAPFLDRMERQKRLRI